MAGQPPPPERPSTLHQPPAWSADPHIILHHKTGHLTPAPSHHHQQGGPRICPALKSAYDVCVIFVLKITCVVIIFFFSLVTCKTSVQSFASFFCDVLRFCLIPVVKKCLCVSVCASKDKLFRSKAAHPDRALLIVKLGRSKVRSWSHAWPRGQCGLRSEAQTPRGPDEPSSCGTEGFL